MKMCVTIWAQKINTFNFSLIKLGKIQFGLLLRNNLSSSALQNFVWIWQTVLRDWRLIEIEKSFLII